MARTPAPTADLEIEVPDGRPVRSKPALSRFRLVAIVAAAAALLGVAFPVRAQVNRDEAARLQRRWTTMLALDESRSGDLTALNRAGAPGDAIEVHAAAGGLYDQQAAEVISLRGNMQHDLIVDPSLRRLRAAMTHALALEAADLSDAARLWRSAPTGRAPSYLDRRADTKAAIAEANRLLAVQATRFSLPAPRPSAPHLYPVADAMLASFERFLDQPTGITLLADTSAGLQTIDIDRSVIRPAQVAGLPAGSNTIVVGRPDFVVFQHLAAQSTFFVAPADLHAPAVAIGTGGQVVAGSDPGTFWLVGGNDSATEVDRAGAVLAGPVALPANRFVVAATAAGLVLQPHLQSDRSGEAEPIEIWDPLHRALVRTISDAGLGVLAANRDTVAWVSASDTIHLTDVSSGAELPVATPGYITELAGAAFSPDGTRLATTMHTPDGSHTVPAVIEVGSGAVRIGSSDEFPPEQPGPIVWTANGDRMFVPMSSATPTEQLLTYRPGDGAPHYLRLPSSEHIGVFAVVALNSG